MAISHSKMAYKARWSTGATNGYWPGGDRSGTNLPRTKKPDVEALENYFGPEAQRVIGDALKKELLDRSPTIAIDVYTVPSAYGDMARWQRAAAQARSGSEFTSSREVPAALTDELWFHTHKLALRLDVVGLAPSPSERNWESWSEAVKEAPHVFGQAVKDVAEFAGETAGAVAGGAASGGILGFLKGLGWLAVPLVLGVVGIGGLAIYAAMKKATK